ncbi:putative protein OS=Tsukamurella paurometabola (strain ATCC 8368 / DSM / CCUG 35730 /CIP 100753 / JCM 10117 / KCTC 9821 / NBRC 16120 / NCIMB 702349/ NCTC 13040) OX=521096 GN=Tpau_1627 PE=4 SV=1 [Tsukamurella paurometabola]|uniref:Uncharacterized protein n=1 Tax=Tsukamurella paurometabola (strain ATCC 8368 / DSM 20162 / CCUG 35730 / CIP 100753 / JCM 10117 / KCTC 9821 / NBRC 16120 / NCIMB 702349 / NCTC 13040) TaxID=521096 RepID=D5UYE1_TSUPD|nr:hypothetical protein [Tsukamurella paurometabola]ADG78248.1 hypothetical protein Tpau_1627 [Tsukamurella paurometabola DSM 20162]SUP30863.1 Uncharacterised protein [Tsukamurella paurometabola]
MHRSASLPDLMDAVASVAPDRRHAAALAVVGDALDRTADPRLDGTGAVLLDEMRAPGSRYSEAQRIAVAVDEADRDAHARRAEGDHTGYVLGFQAARALSALLFLVRDGGAGLADVAYEAVMVCGATEPVVAVLVGGRR